MALPIKDGEATLTSLKSTLSGTDHVVHRIVDEMPATADSTGLPAIPAQVLMVGAQNPSAKCVPLSVDSSGYLNTATTITGSATETKQDTIITKLTDANTDLAALEVLVTASNVDLDAIETLQTSANALLTAIDSDTNDIKTAVEIIDNAISGNEMQVDVKTVDLPSAGVQFTVTVATSATALTAGAISSGFYVMADSANTANVYLGFASGTLSTANGFPLAAGKEKFFSLSNTNLLYYISANTADKLHIIGS